MSSPTSGIGKSGNLTATARTVGRDARRARAIARATEVAPIVAEIQAAGVTSLHGIARALNTRGVPTATGVLQLPRVSLPGCPPGLTLAGTSASAPGSAKQRVCDSLGRAWWGVNTSCAALGTPSSAQSQRSCAQPASWAGGRAIGRGLMAGILPTVGRFSALF